MNASVTCICSAPTARQPARPTGMSARAAAAASGGRGSAIKRRVRRELGGGGRGGRTLAGAWPAALLGVIAGTAGGRCGWRRRAARRGHRRVGVVVEDLVELLAVEGLLLHQLRDDLVEEMLVRREDVVRAPARALNDVVDLVVDELGDFLG